MHFESQTPSLTQLNITALPQRMRMFETNVVPRAVRTDLADPGDASGPSPLRLRVALLLNVYSSPKPCASLSRVLSSS